MESKPFYQSWGFWGVMVAAMLQTLESQNVIPMGGLTTITNFGALVVALYGRSRAKGPLTVS